MAGRNTVEIIIAARDQASRAVRSAFGGIQSASKVAMGAVAAGAVAAGGALLTLSGVISKTGIAYNAMAESSQVAWKTLLGSQEEAKKMLEDIANFAKATPFETEQVDMMAKYMHNAGLEGKGLFDALMKVSDVASAFNIPAAEAQELTRQMSQVRQAGLAYTEDLNVLQDRGVPIYKAISQQLGITVADVKKMASEGKLTSDIYIKAFDGIAKGVKGASDAQSKTFSGMISTLKDNLKMISGELSKPLFEQLKAGMEAITPILTSFMDGLKKGGLQGGLAAIFPSSVVNVIAQVSQGLDKAKEAISGVFALFNGNTGGGISMLSRIGLGPEVIRPAVEAVDKIKTALGVLKGAFDILTGDSIGGITFLTKMGLSPETITKVVQTVNGIKSTISNFVSAYIGYIKGLFSGEGNLGQSFMKIFNTAKSIVMPLLSEIIAFIKDKIAMIKQFWDENGAQITQAVKNAWAVIAAVFKFIAPVILGILRMLWDAIAGIIDGAIKIIMGIIKVFAGLFTGDFSKMWEGIKQIFFGAIEAVWNYLNLLMFGRIIGGIKSFVTGGVTHFTGFWTKTVEVFKNLDTHLWSIITNIVSKIGGVLKGFVDEGIRIFGTLRSFGASIFESLWAAIRTVAMNMATGVKNFFLDMVQGAKFHMDGLVSKAQSIFNAVKTAITNPIETAKTTVGKAIEAIKGFFGNMTSKIKMPHFSIAWSSATAFGKTIRYPTGFDVDWYDKGGVFYGPQVIGVGEKRPEFVGALDDLRKIVREETSNNNAAFPPGNVEIPLIIDGYELTRLIIPFIDLIQGNNFSSQLHLDGVK